MNFAKRIDWIRENLNKSVRLREKLLAEIPVAKEKVLAQEQVVDELSTELHRFYKAGLAFIWQPVVEDLEYEEQEQDDILDDLDSDLENLEGALENLESSIEAASYDAVDAVNYHHN